MRDLGTGWNVGWTPRSAQDYRRIAETGARHVRLGFTLKEVQGEYVFAYESTPGVALLKQQCKYAKRNGLHVVLAAFLDPNDPGAMQALQDSTALQESLCRVMETLARELRPWRNVSFDLLNEPILQNWMDLALKLALRVRAQDKYRRLILEPTPGGVPDAFASATVLPLQNVTYSVHMYERHEFTHQGVLREFQQAVPYTPGQVAGFLAAVDAFQRKHKARVYVGEFSVVAWAPGRDLYLQECYAAFSARRWSWAYHAWRAWPGWDAELSYESAIRSKSTSTYTALVKAMRSKPC